MDKQRPSQACNLLGLILIDETRRTYIRNFAARVLTQFDSKKRVNGTVILKSPFSPK